MASIHKKAEQWYIAYTDGAGKRHFVPSGIPHSPPGTNSTDTRRKARECERKAIILANEMEQLAQGSQRVAVVRKRCGELLARARSNQAEHSGITLKGYFARWTEEKLPDVGPSYGNQLKRCQTDLAEALQDRFTIEIVQVDEEDIDSFVDHLLEQKLGARSINKRLHILSELFRHAEAKAFIIVTPVNDDHFQEEMPNERQVFVPRQVELILGTTPRVDWHTVTLFGFYAGMRLGDARSQTWDAIDFERRVITWIPEKTTRQRAHKAKVIITPLHPVLYDHLLKVKEMSSDQPHITPSLANRPISNLSNEFVALIRAAGIDPVEVTQPNGRVVCLLTNHSLRHAFATELKRTGAPEKEWTKLTGHTAKFSRWNGESISQVARIYNHVDVEDLRQWIEKLPSLCMLPPACLAAA